MYTSTKIHATCVFTINTHTMIILILMIILITDMLQHDLALLTVCCCAFKTISQSSVPFQLRDNICAPPYCSIQIWLLWRPLIFGCIAPSSAHTHTHTHMHTHTKSAPIQVLSLSFSLSHTHTPAPIHAFCLSLSLPLTCHYITILVDWDKTLSYLL